MRYHIEFDIEVPDDVPEKDVSEWGQYMVGDTGRLRLDHPLIEKSFDPIFGTFKIKRAE